MEIVKFNDYLTLELVFNDNLTLNLLLKGSSTRFNSSERSAEANQRRLDTSRQR